MNRAVDERNDPVKATTAALDYLGDLHERFGSWYLAAAAYNMGENGLARILRATPGRAGHGRRLLRIWNRLPKETRDYVPLMVAAARIAQGPGGSTASRTSSRSHPCVLGGRGEAGHAAEDAGQEGGHDREGDQGAEPSAQAGPHTQRRVDGAVRVPAAEAALAD